MPDPNAEAEKKLRRLAERVRRGRARLQPLTEKELNVVRQAVRRQWEYEHRPGWAEEKGKALRKAQRTRSQRAKSQQQDAEQAPVKKPPEQSHEQDYGHSH